MTVRAKICGLSSRTAVEAAVEGGASYLGFIFYPPSPRNVTPAAAAGLAALAPRDVETVAVFVDPTDAELDAVLSTGAFSMIQLHGHETPERVREVKEKFGRRVIKAIPVAGRDDLAAATLYTPVADLLLFDAKPPRSMVDALPGGNGLRFDWELLRDEWRSDLPWMLSGGLDETVLAEAVAVSGAAGVDISSGVELRPGEKSPDRIRRFLDAVKAL